MQLVYLYIHKYKGIERFACPFTSKYLFETVIDKDDTKKIRLTVSLNNQHIPDFFEGTNTSEVTAIIGQNGAGKSSIIRWIRKSLDDHNSGFFEHIILGFENEHGELIIEQEAGLKLDLAVNDGIRHRTEEVGEVSRAFGVRSRGHTLSGFYQNVSTIYYSNTLDYAMRNGLLRTWYDIDDEDSADSYNLDISTRYLLLHASSKNDGEDSHKLENFILDEQKRSVLFGLGQNEYQLPFPVPPTYALELNLPKDYDGHLKRDIGDLLTRIARIHENNRRFMFGMDVTFIVGIISRLKLTGLITENEVSIKETINEFYEILEQEKYNSTQHIEHLLQKIVTNSELAKLEKGIKYYLNKLRTGISAVYAKAWRDLDNDYSIYLRNGVFSQIELTGILELISDEAIGIPLFNYYWRGLSSGEQSMLSFYSRLYEIRNQVHSSNVLILIDEGDAYFHPEWQRKFLSDVTKFVSKLFATKKVQYIFSSNTPFIAADLPTSKVIHLERDNECRTSVAVQVTNETFASNIHTLLASNFYLSSFLGEFAKDKIEGMVKELNKQSKDLSAERRENIKKLISQVGEPIIKKRLEHLYFEKTGEGTETVEDRIKKLRDEADRLDKGQQRNEDQ